MEMKTVGIVGLGYMGGGIATCLLGHGFRVLGFTRPAEEAEAAALTFEVSPTSDQPTGLVIEMGQFDLQAAFRRCGSLSENLEDQASAVDDLAPGLVLQGLLLDWCQRRIDHQQFRVIAFREGPDFFHLAFAEQAGDIPKVRSFVDWVLEKVNGKN